MTFQLSPPRGPVAIRQALPEDASPLLDLRLESLRMHPKAFAADLDQTAAQGVKAIFDRITEYEHNQSGTIMIALSGSELIGMAGIARGHWPKTQHGGWLWGVYVRPDWRGNHIGEGIITGCIAWGLKHHLSIVYLSVTVADIPAIRCYTRCGFREYGLEPRSLFIDGQYHDHMLMCKVVS